MLECYVEPPAEMSLSWAIAGFELSSSLSFNSVSYVSLSLQRLYKYLRGQWVTRPSAVPGNNLGCDTRKGPKCPESLSYQKKDGRAGLRPPFLWYDTDFSKQKTKKRKKKKHKKSKKKISKTILKSRCHTKSRMGAAPRSHPSFGMTTT